ncbi:MAG: diaminopimelate epimerase [Candidatus Bathyarchaeia archaeon]
MKKKDIKLILNSRDRKYPMNYQSLITLTFSKMQGLGNDYILIDNRDAKIREDKISNLAQKLCVRRFSVGADGLILLYNSDIADAKMRIFNADGSEAEMCGNGIRCLAKYCYENGIVNKTEMEIETLAGVKKIWLELEEGKIKAATVAMGKPVFERSLIPMIGKGKCINEDLKVDNATYKITCLSVGNPHCVIFVEDVDSFPVEKIGPKIERHGLFPKRTNVEFVQALKNDEIKVRVWERGVGETFACGTGACASVVAGNLLQKSAKACTVHLLGGDLKVKYADDNIMMSGPAETVFKGVMDLEVS